MNTPLQQVFETLIKAYTNDTTRIEKMWNEIEHAYSGSKRHYHTLQHLENILGQLTSVRDNISDWDTILFTLFYHDVVYKAHKSDNEEQSAVLAVKRMNQLSIAEEKISRCEKQILATKSHLQQSDLDINYFTDADLSVLGQEWASYEIYVKQIRNEYAIYPDFLYKPGRKKVLQHFLNMPRIFKTDYFFYTLEAQAKNNIQQELELLGKQ